MTTVALQQQYEASPSKNVPYRQPERGSSVPSRQPISDRRHDVQLPERQAPTQNYPTSTQDYSKSSRSTQMMVPDRSMPRSDTGEYEYYYDDYDYSLQTQAPSLTPQGGTRTAVRSKPHPTNPDYEYVYYYDYDEYPVEVEPKDHSTPVSYTHLTLPTNREV